MTNTGARGGDGVRPLFTRAARALARGLTPFLLVLLVTTPAFAAEGVGGEVDPLIYRLAVFALAIFVGYYVVWSVTPALHTPLMSVTNAISSVIVVGAMLATGLGTNGWAMGFGFIAVTLASVNIFGGFVVTQRMLSMFRKRQ
jgi:H+-translocating NAD(P) transhydrogenase subunit alpha